MPRKEIKTVTTETVPALAPGLAERALKALAFTKLKVTAALLLAVSVFVGGVGAVAYRALAGEQPTMQDQQGPKQLSEEVTRAKAATEKPGPTDVYGDPLPLGALARMGTVQLRHGGAGTAFSPDGNVLATADGSALRLWSMASGKLLLQVKEDHEWWGPVMFSPDGKLLARSCAESVYLLNAATGKLVRRIPAVDRVLAFSPDSELVATSTNTPEGKPASVILWHTPTGQQAFQLRGQGRYVYGAEFTPEGRTLVTMCSSQQQRSDKVICHWDVATGALRKTVVLHLPLRPLSSSLCLSPDGQTVAHAPKHSKAVGLWDTNTGKQRATLEEDLAETRQLAFTRDSRTLATASFESDAIEGSLALWDVATGKRLHGFTVPCRAVYSLQFAPDGRTLLTSSGGPRVYLCDTTTGRPRWQREAHDGEFISLSFTPDGRTLVSGSNDGTIRVWATATGLQVRELPGHPRGVHAVAVLPDGQTLLSGGYDGVIRLQELQTGKQLRCFLIDQESEKLPKPAYNLHGLGLAADGRSVASFSYRSEEGPAPEIWHVWDLATGRTLLRPANRSHIYFDSFSPDAKLMAGYVSTGEPVEDDEPVAVVEEVATGRRLLTLPQPDNGHSLRLVFAPDGQTLATVTSRVRRDWDESYYVHRHAIRLWETATGKERLTIMNDVTGDQLQYAQLAFAPDGRTLATARKDHTLQLWDIATGQELLRRTGYDVDISGHAFSLAPEGRTLATGHLDSTILIWDLAPETWRRQRLSRPLDAQELNAAWADLASADARKAHVAIWKLVAVPQQAVPLLRERLRPAAAVPADRLRQLLSDLNSRQFRQREAATKQLTDLEEQAEPALQDVLKGNPPAEQRRRIESLLAGPRMVPAPEKLRGLRAIQVVEQCNLPEAREVLGTLAQGSSEARLTQEANAALARLSKRTDPSR